MPDIDLLGELLQANCTPEAWTWLQAIGADAAALTDPLRLSVAYAGCGRRLGQGPLASHGRQLAWQDRDHEVLADASARDAGRAWLLLNAARLATGTHGASLLAGLFATGDNAEREILLKALPLLAEPERFTDLAVDACRSHVQSVFEAIACHNPYPARYFSEPAFNQLVMKAAFTGVALKRVVGLPERFGETLRQMLEGFASERRAAGRLVAKDVEQLIGDAKP